MRSNLYKLFTTLSFVAVFFITQQANAQYCVDNLYTVGCTYGDYIDNLSVGEINQTATGCGNNGYSDYTNLTATFEQGSTNALTLTVGNYGEYVEMWIDLNDDYNFDASEKLISYLYCYQPNTNFTANFYVPPFATLGPHRMRVRCVQYTFPFDACSNYYYGEVHDYTANIIPPSNMSYVSSTTTQTATDNVSLGSTDVEIIGIQVSTSGSLNPLNATSFTINSNGSTNPSTDIAGVKIYYTGSSPVFANDNLFGSASNFSVPITGNQALVPGVNYFWVAYDISQSGIVNDYVDAECTSLSVGGSSFTPTVTAPPGARQIGYCTPNNTFGCYLAYIDGVEINTLSNTFSYCNGNANGYIVYDPIGSLTTTLQQGSGYAISLTGSPYEYEGFGVWIDFNNDGDFDDPGEFVFSSPTTGTGTQTGNVNIPLTATLGDHRMRVRCKDYATVGSSEACATFSYGEAEDYTVTIGPASDMTFVSSTTTQDNTDFILPGSTNQEIIGIQVVTQGALNAFDLTSLSINSNGSTFFSNDVSNVHVYYTGTSGVFATTTLFGSSTDLSNPITGNQVLSSGTNYFWVAYDISSTSTIGDVVDAECTQIVMDGNGGTQIPDITAPAGNREINYCTPTTTYGCSWSYIDGVVFNTLSNTSSGCNGSPDGYIQYDPSQYTTSVEQGGTYPITITGGSIYEYMGFGVWIDFNNDGDFSDPGEFCWSSPYATAGVQTGTINIPSTATIGQHRMRVRSKDGYILFSSESCGNLLYYAGESEDYTISITAPSAMTYISSTTTQNNTDAVSAGSLDQEIIGIQISTQGSLSPFNVTSFTINNNGTSVPADITNYKIYYTGTSSSFAATNLFGSTTDPSSPITGNQVLQGGTNYFWLAYDISASAAIGDLLDAECTQIVMDGNGGTQVPTVTAPVGNREVNYCTATFQYGCYFAYIDGVTLNTLVNTGTYCNGNLDGYIQYPQSGNTTTELEEGQNYTLQLDGSPYYGEGFGVWIDFNNDGDFSDQGEFVYQSPYVSYGSQFTTISIPCNSDYVGDHRMRVRAFDYFIPGDTDACSTTQYYGETEDYTITFNPSTTNQTYQSSNCTQNNQNTVGLNTPDVEILGIQVTAAGCNSPLTVTSFTLDNTGTTNFNGDVTNVKIYYTGTSSVFATTNLFGSATNVTNPITGSQQLNSGTNYFWVAYDVSATATLGDFIDAGCDQIQITGQGAVTPFVTQPFGNRQINLCVPTMYYSCYYGDYINNFTLNTLSNLNSGCNGNVNMYINYPASQFTTSLQAGNSYDLSVASGYGYDGYAVWIDFNNNASFDDPGELVWASPSEGYSFSGTITIPLDPSFYGDRRMRVRSSYYTVFGSQDACTNEYEGETEDYTVTILAPPSCTGTPTAGTITADPAVLCDPGNTSTLSVIGYSPASDLTFKWQSSSDGITFSNIPGATNTTYSPTLSSTTYYRVKVTCSNSSQSSFSDTAKVEVGGSEAITSTTGATICGEGPTSISAVGNSDYVLWYNNSTDVVPAYSSSSPSTYTPYVNQTTTFYAAAATGVVNTGHVGPANDSIGPLSQYYTYTGENFSVLKPCTIVGVYVYPLTAGNVVITLDSNYYSVRTVTVPVSQSDVNQKTWIPLGWSMSIGNNYEMAWTYGSVTLWCNDYNYNGYSYPYTIPGVISINTSSYNSSYYYFNYYDWVIDYSQLCISTKVPVTVTTIPAPQVTITADPVSATICNGSGQSVSLTAAGGTYNAFTWSPADGLTATSGSTVSASPTQNTSYFVLATDGTCTDADTVSVFVADPPNVTATASPDAVCAGGASQLYASIPATNYSVSQITFAPLSDADGIPIALTDESVSQALPVGFDFNFYGNDYTQFWIGANGYLTFTDPMGYSYCCQGQYLPNSFTPNNLIGFCWEDLNPGVGGTVSYWTTGTAPYRKCVIEFKDIQHYVTGDPVTVQTILYETTNIIEIHTTSMPGNPSGYWAPHTEGIENSDGTIGLAVPGRNADNTWTATDDAWRFAPEQLSYSWSPTNTLDNPTSVSPIATPSTTTTYTVSVTDVNTLCSSTATATVSLVTSPTAGTISPTTSEYCGNGSSLLTLDGYTPGATIQWQESNTQGGPYSNIAGATDDSYTTPSNDFSTYYVAQVSCQSNSTSGEASVLVDQPPADPTAIDGGNCGPGQVILGAQGNGNGQLNWFYSQNGNNFLGTGSPFTTPYINQTTTFYVSEGDPAPTPLTTTLTGYLAYMQGNMFDITATNDVYITGFDINMNSSYTSDFEVYYKPGTYAGSESTPSNWTLVGTAQGIVGGGYNVATPLNLQLFIHIPAGQTAGFYITCANYYSYPNMTYGSGIGNVYAQDNNIQVKEGVTNYYAFGYSYGPYVWNGKVHYVAPGCASPLVPVVAQIYSPQVLATASANPICEGTTIQLGAVNTGSGNFNYEWMPQIPGMIPPNGLSDTVSVAPQVSTTFTVSVTDPNAPLCDTTITVPVIVNPTPGVFISDLLPQYYNNDPAFTLNGVPPGGTFSGPGVTGDVFDPSSLPIGTYTITYTYTDANGCTGSYSQNVNIVPIEGISSVGIDRGISIYPNPSEGVFNLDIKLPSAAQSVIVTIHDMVGRQVFENNFGGVTGELITNFDFSKWAKGSYYAAINVDGQLFYRKITIQ